MNAPAFMSAKKGDGSDREPFAAFLSDEASTTALTQVVEEQGWNTSRIQSGGIANAVRSLAVTASPLILIIDMSHAAEPQSDISALAEVCEPGTIVIALGTTNDVNFYRGLLASGVFDYLVKPVTPEMLRSAILHAEEALRSEPEPEPAASQAARLISFVGLRGGAGTSTIAMNTAWTIANDLGRSVGFLDLDVNFGTSALCFDMEPGRGLADALENPGRVDSLFIDRAMLKHSDNLAILGAESPVSESIMPDPAALVHLLDEMRDHFEIVAQEIPRHMLGQYPFLLTESSYIALIGDMTLASVRDAIRVLGYLKEIAPKVPVVLIGNKCSPQAEVSRKDFEHAIERPLDMAIPFDPKTAMAAAKSAKMLAQISKGSKAVVGVRDLANRLTGSETKNGGQPFWARLKRNDRAKTKAKSTKKAINAK